VKSCPISDRTNLSESSSLGEAWEHKEIKATIEIGEVNMNCSNRMTLAFLLLSVLTVYGCEDLVIRDTSSLLAPRFQRSEILGLVAGFGTTFAAVPDLVAMLKRRSSAGMNPRMAGIMGVFQIAWVYYGLLIASRPVIVWNMIGIVINFVNVGAYLYFVRKARL
jgi:MtN3 and saliva related transmembrane protein